MVTADVDFCTPEDLEELWEIELECFPQPWERHVVENDLHNLGPIIYVKATMKGRIAGFAVMTREHGGIHLQNIAVRKEFRREGIATQLIVAVDEIGAIWGYRRMWLEVRPSNSEARKFYDELGFVYKTRVRSYYADGEDALVLMAKLPFAIKEDA